MEHQGRYFKYLRGDMQTKFNPAVSDANRVILWECRLPKRAAAPSFPTTPPPFSVDGPTGVADALRKNLSCATPPVGPRHRYLAVEKRCGIIWTIRNAYCLVITGITRGCCGASASLSKIRRRVVGSGRKPEILKF